MKKLLAFALLFSTQAWPQGSPILGPGQVLYNPSTGYSYGVGQTAILLSSFNAASVLCAPNSTTLTSSGTLTTGALIIGGGSGPSSNCPSSLVTTGVVTIGSNGVASAIPYNVGSPVSVTNVVFGQGATSAISSGTYNTFYGYNAGYKVTSGSSNMAVGALTLESLLTGSNNTAIGGSTLISATGSSNTSIGAGSSYLLTTGSNNTAIGNSAGGVTTTGNFNVSIGNSCAPSGAAVSNTIQICATSGATPTPIFLATGGATPGTSASSVAGTLGTGTFTIGTLPTCNASLVGYFATVTNGVASPTYFGAVSTTGAQTDPVYCTFNGTATYTWVYH